MFLVTCVFLFLNTMGLKKLENNRFIKLFLVCFIISRSEARQERRVSQFKLLYDFWEKVTPSVGLRVPFLWQQQGSIQFKVVIQTGQNTEVWATRKHPVYILITCFVFIVIKQNIYFFCPKTSGNQAGSVSRTFPDILVCFKRLLLITIEPCSSSQKLKNTIVFIHTSQSES